MTDHASVSVAEKLERSRRDVLDLTLRNSLLNFRVLKAKGVKVIDEIPREIYRILVRQKKAMYFEAVGEDLETGSHDDDQEIPEELLLLMVAAEDDLGQLAERHIDNKLQTPYRRERLVLRLRNTYRHAQLSIQEQGVNILYLAMGTLNWYESDSSDMLRMAPLVLVPVELEKASNWAGFKLRWTDEEIEVNLSLETKLKTDFRIELPELPDVEDLDINEYFKGVAKVVSSRQRWSVDTTAIHLGFFSFSKLLIYKDLDPRVWPEDGPPADHPVVGALYSDEGFSEDPPTIAEDDHLDDHLKVSDTHQVLDSDSSQTLAIIDVKRGRNVVIQGPPGTGKSQTITNLIAEAIADQKTVLFVAEKMAALEVVKRRLDNVHIGDACLELHSHKANKRSILDELKRTLELGRPQLGDPSEDRLLLEERRRRLNEYARVVNSPIGESGFTPNELIGRLFQIESSHPIAEWPALAIEGSISWSRQDFVRRQELVRELRALIDGMGTPAEHVYWESGRAHYTDRVDVRAKLKAASKALRQWKDHVDVLRSRLEPEVALEDPEPTKVAMLVRTAHRVIEAPTLGNVDHRSQGWIDRAAEIGGIARGALELVKVHATHDSVLIPEAWESDVLECRQGILVYGDKWWKSISGKYRKSRDRLRGLCRSDFPAEKAEQLALIDGILRVQHLRKGIEGSRELLSQLYPGVDLDSQPSTYQRLGEVAQWLLSLHAETAVGTIDRGIHDMLDRNLDRVELETASVVCKSSSDTLVGALHAVASVLEWRVDRAPDGSAFVDRAFSRLEIWMASAHEQVDSLREIIRFNQTEKKLADLGLDSVAEVSECWKGWGRASRRPLRASLLQSLDRGSSP